MALNLKNPEVERLAEELAALAGSSKTEAIRQALLEKKQRLQLAKGKDQKVSARRFLEERVWPNLLPGASRPLTREQEDDLLGYGPDGFPI